MTRRLDRRLGFTMVELLVALTLLSAIGALLLQLVRGSFVLYRDGDRRGDLYSTAIPVLEMLEDDDFDDNEEDDEDDDDDEDEKEEEEEEDYYDEDDDDDEDDHGLVSCECTYTCNEPSIVRTH